MFLRVINKSLRDNSGMTLIEVMMAVAVFGIILVFITQMTGAGSRITGYNLDQVRMSELALAEAENIKAGHGSYDDTNKTIDYPPGATGGEVQQTYAILYEKNSINEMIMLKITVGPVDSTNSDNPLDSTNPDNYVLVAWLP